MPMFAKRVKCVRDMNHEVEILEKRLGREISKLNSNILLEIKKKLKKVIPGIQVHMKKIKLDDFLSNQRRDLPLQVLIESLNGKQVHTTGVWVEQDRETGMLFKTDNRIDVSHFQEICQELSEDLDVNIQIERVSGTYR